MTGQRSRPVLSVKERLKQLQRARAALLAAAAPNAGGEPVQRAAQPPRSEQGAATEEEDAVSVGSDQADYWAEGSEGGEPDQNDPPADGQGAGEQDDEDGARRMSVDGASPEDGRPGKASKRSKRTKGSKAAKAAAAAAARAMKAATAKSAAQLVADFSPMTAKLTASKRIRAKTSSLAVKKKKLQKKRSPYRLRPRQLAAELDASLVSLPTSGTQARANTGAAALSAAAIRAAAPSPRAEPTPARGASSYRQAVVNGAGSSQQRAAGGAGDDPVMMRQMLRLMEANHQLEQENQEKDERCNMLEAEKASLLDALFQIEGGLDQGDEDLRGSAPADGSPDQDLPESDSDKDDSDGSEPEPEYDDLRQLLDSLRAKQASAATAARSDSAKQLRAIAAKPQHFDGQNSRQGIRDWLAGLKEYILLVADNCTPESQIKLAATFLKDSALRVWQTERAVLPFDQRSSWDVFEQVMLDRYDTGTDAVTARFQLDALHQRDGQSMVSFIQLFDMLISYVPDMGEKEKVHRFLASVRSDVHDKLHLNPLTNERWTRYVDLRRFALKQYAHETAMRAASAASGRHRRLPRNGGLQRAGISSSAAGDKRGAGDGWQPAGKRGKPSRFVQGQQGQRGSGAQQQQSRDQQQRRSQAVKTYCYNKGMCYRCYADDGHNAVQCNKPWVIGDPPGYRAAGGAGH